MARYQMKMKMRPLDRHPQVRLPSSRVTIFGVRCCFAGTVRVVEQVGRKRIGPGALVPVVCSPTLAEQRRSLGREKKKGKRAVQPTPRSHSSY